ncbi:fibroblast growth factor receptor 1-like [Branchiostoma floridae]|uniref:Fibroblast growth factor receptor 1-like n=1 Tax=Branchiostoma floridae TaxID=7739 RepID=A0A9J7N816_BRAFL|nr:fibroblast growth factor receptor 1-like [Branchiostoma floridae]
MEMRVFLVLAYGYWTGLAQRFSLVTRPVPVLEHTNVTLTCTAPDSIVTEGEVQQVHWFYTRREESLAPQHVFEYNGPDDQRGHYHWYGRTVAESFSELTISNVTVEDTGFYHCRLRGSSSHITRIKSHLTVLVPTSRLELQPTNTTFREGEEVKLSCSANGIPEPYLQWTNGASDSDTRGPVQGHSVSLGPLSLSWADNKRNVTCVAEQRHPLINGHVLERSVTLNVLYAPRITSFRMSEEGLNLTCEVDANPPATYILLKKGNETLLRTNGSKVNSVTYSTHSPQGANHTGLYTCVAENSLDLTRASIRCETDKECGLEERPVTVTAISATELVRNPTVEYLGIALGGLAVAILTLGVVMHVKRGRTQSRRQEGLAPASVDGQELLHDTVAEDRPHEEPDDVAQSVALVDLDDRPPMPLPRPKPRFPKYELGLDRLHIDMSHVIGRGAFAKVFKGTLIEKGREEQVAIKTIKENATEEETKLFYEEIGIVIDIGSHGNVLRMRGCCTTHDPSRPLLVMEYMPYGNLLNFLEKCKEVRNGAACDDPMYLLEEKMKYQIGSQVAGGMQYICKQKYIHGDLAARNILVSKGQTIVVKISDFGLTADIYQKGYKRQDPDQLVPYKWISLERLQVNGRCTEKSDVWSFGVLLYEVVTLGGPPYPNIHFAEILRDKLSAGWRMEMPEDCSFFM